MKVLAHRGYWNEIIKKNTSKALRTALYYGYGFESDVRDYCGRMVISHDIADSSCQDAEEVFKWLNEFEDRYTFAINIKADGLKHFLHKYLTNYKISNYFLFDMTTPQMIEFREMGLRFFSRQSEVEPQPLMYDEAAGIWIDGFWSVDWITEDLLSKHLNNGKQICLVSPDLHGNIDYQKFWRRLKEYKIDFSRVMICTDYPDEARAFFDE